jgi:hypothetical protein
MIKIFALAAFALSSVLFAENHSASEPSSQETAQFGNRRTPILGAKSGRESKNKPTVIPEELKIETEGSVITPSVYPCVNRGSNTYATLDFLWWKTVIGGTDYAVNGCADGYNTSLGTNVKSGTQKRADFGFEPGLKLGLGTYLDGDGWDLYLQYTHLAGPEEKNSIRTSLGKGGKTLIPITTGDGVVAPISFELARSQWRQDFNVVDLELGRNFFISQYLILRPSIGLKTAWIHEVLKYTFAPTPDTSDPRSGGPNEVLAVYSLRQQHMWGLGLRGSIDTMWHITKNWAIYGDIAFTTLWANFHTKAQDKLTESIMGQYQSLDLHYAIQSLVPVIETGLGLAYVTWFSDNDYRFQLQAGWEHQVWTDMNYFQLSRSGALSAQGLTVKAALAF